MIQMGLPPLWYKTDLYPQSSYTEAPLQLKLSRHPQALADRVLSRFPPYRIIPHDLAHTALAPAPLQAVLCESEALGFKSIPGTV